MSLESILPGTDNFFKYLLTIGLVLILFALVYPLKKEQDLKIEAIQISIDEQKLESDISHLEASAKELTSLQDSLTKKINVLDNIKKLNPSEALNIEKEKTELQKIFDEKKSKGIEKGYELRKNDIELEGTRQKHCEIKRQIWSYFIFKIGFIAIGVIFSIAGFRFWMASAYADDLIKTKDLLQNQEYKSSYVRCLEYCKSKKRIHLLLIIVILLVVVAGLSWLITPL